LQSNAVPHRTQRAGQARWSSLNRSEPRRPELLMRHTGRKFGAKRPRHTACDPRAIADGEPRSRTGSYGHPTVAGTEVLGKHLRWSEHYELVRKWWWSGTGSNCRPSAFQDCGSLAGDGSLAILSPRAFATAKRDREPGDPRQRVPRPERLPRHSYSVSRFWP